MENNSSVFTQIVGYVIVNLSVSFCASLFVLKFLIRLDHPSVYKYNLIEHYNI